MARGIWKGTLGFGLVNIGVELLTAEEPDRLDIDLLDRRDMARVGYQQINKTTGRPIEKKQVVRGIAVEKGRYVLLDDKELKAANPVATQTIEVLGFVGAADIPPLYYAKPYYVAPLKGSEKAYRLFATALARSERIGLAQLVIHIRQYVAAVYPLEGTLVVQLLRYAADIREPAPIAAAGRAAPRPAELTMADQLIESMVTRWKPESFHDTYRDDILKLVKRRASKAKSSAEPAETRSREPVVLDLMAALKRSLHTKSQVHAASRTRRAAGGTGRHLRSAG
jgi:DNA end-binding protein Ku